MAVTYKIPIACAYANKACEPKKRKSRSGINRNGFFRDYLTHVSSLRQGIALAVNNPAWALPGN